MEGHIENCSELATTPTSASPPNSVSSPRTYGLQDAIMTTGKCFFSLAETFLENSSKEIEVPKENATVKVFDFEAEESEKMVEFSEGRGDSFSGETGSKDGDKQQIDVEATFSKDNMEDLGESRFERGFKSPANKSNKVQPPRDTSSPGYNGAGGQHRESTTSILSEPLHSKESKIHQQNSVQRNKSIRTDRGLKFFKKKIFSRSMKSKNVGKGSTLLESFDGDGRHEPSPNETLAKDDDWKKGICYCDSTNRISELENTIKQLENDKTSLEGEKFDLMNALSTIWIEMEDFKNGAVPVGDTADMVTSSAEDKPTITTFQVDHHDEDILDAKANETSPILKRISKSQEVSHPHSQEEQIKTIIKTKSLQSETLHSLRIKLSVVNEDKESLSRKLNEMFENNKALEESLQNISAKTKPEVDKILEENLAFRFRLDNLASDKLLLEADNQKLKVEKKKHKLMKLQIQKGCENLIHRINEVLQTTHVDKASEVTNRNPASSKTPIEKSLLLSEVSPNVDKDRHSVKQIVRKLERTNSIDHADICARDKVMKEASTRDRRSQRAPANIRRAETLNSKSFNSDLADEKKKEMKVNRFPPAQPSKGDQLLKHLKSSSGNDAGFRDDTVSSGKVFKDNRTDPCLKFFEHLQAKCLVLLERFSVLDKNVERDERNGDIYNSMLTQGMHSSTPSSSGLDDTVPVQSSHKDAVLLSCLRNLQKENDYLKLENLKYTALVANMQEKCNEDRSERKEDEITAAEKNSIRRDFHDLANRVVAERDFGLLKSMPNGNDIENGEKEPRVTKSVGQLGDSDEVRIVLNQDSNHQLKGEEEAEEDVSSWHRKYFKESAKVFQKNERIFMKLRQITSMEQLAKLQDTSHNLSQGDAYAKSDGINQINADRQTISGNTIWRAVSFDEGKALSQKWTQQPKRDPANDEESRSVQNGLQKHDQEDGVTSTPNNTNNVSSDGTALASAETCCKLFSLHGHHHQHCNLRRMSLVQDDSSTATPKPREKTLKKNMSTNGRQDGQYKVHYV